MRQPSQTTSAAICKLMSGGRIHRTGGSRWACVCSARVWRQGMSLPRVEMVSWFRACQKNLRMSQNNQRGQSNMFLYRVEWKILQWVNLLVLRVLGWCLTTTPPDFSSFVKLNETLSLLKSFSCGNPLEMVLLQMSVPKLTFWRFH